MTLPGVCFTLLQKEHSHLSTVAKYVKVFTEAEVTDDLENKRSASLNFLFLLSALLFVFLKAQTAP